MPAPIEIVDQAPPQPNSAAYGFLREQFLEAVLLDRPARIPGACEKELRAWADEVLEQAEGDLIGLNIHGVPEDMLPVLRWAGIPLSLTGPLLWVQDFDCADVSRPCLRDDKLLLPNADQLSLLTSLAIRPIRHYVGKRFGIRLQAATSLSCYLWSNQALIISSALVRAGGFLHGPHVGQRASIAIDPGSAQIFNWLDEE